MGSEHTQDADSASMRKVTTPLSSELQTIRHGRKKVSLQMPKLSAKEAAEYAEAVTNILDEALSRAEVRLQHLFDPARTGFARMTPAQVADAFARHVATHLRDELTDATRHGNSVATYRRAVNEGTDSAF